MSAHSHPTVPATGSTVMLTHYGRTTGKPYRVKIWFAVVDGKVWIGSLSHDRSWVRNLRASGRAELDFGSGARPANCRWAGGAAEVERFGQAIRSKYYILGPLLALFVRGERCAFETDLAARA
jgi:deazaflavin-dependent oxidoreductase (nitroreductase family)